MDAWTLSLAVSNGIIAVIALVLAALIAIQARGRSANLLLALLLLVIGANGIASMVVFVPDPWWSLNGSLWSNITYTFVPSVYLLFVAAALPTPLVRPLRARFAPVLVLLPFFGLSVTLFAISPEGWVRLPDGSWIVDVERYALLLYGWITLMCIALGWGFAAAVSTYRRAPPGSLTRDRARAYLWAFGVQDVGIASSLFLFPLGVAPAIVFAIQSVAALTSILLLTRALLRYQLFDFDLKVKLGVKRGTIAVAFVGAFFVATTIAEQYLQRYGVVAGGLAAGILLFAMRPLERAAERIADRAMPSVQPTPAYLTFKKLEVYRAAVESALEGGEIDERERGTLERLRAKLGIEPSDAASAELDARERLAPTAAA